VKPATSPTLPDREVDAVVEEEVPDEVVAVMAAVDRDQQASLEHILRMTSDSLVMTTAQLPRCTEN